MFKYIPSSLIVKILDKYGGNYWVYDAVKSNQTLAECQTDNFFASEQTLRAMRDGDIIDIIAIDGVGLFLIYNNKEIIVIKNVTNKTDHINNNIQYLMPNGNDNNDGYSFDTGVSSLQKAISNLGDLGGTIFVMPKVGGYIVSSAIISKEINIISLGTNYTTEFIGTLTFAHSTGNIQLNHVTATNLIHSGDGNLYLNSGAVTNTFVTSGLGNLQTSQTDLSNALITINSIKSHMHKLVSFTNNSLLGRCEIDLVNNSSMARVSITGCSSIKSIKINNGFCEINNSTIYAEDNISYAISIINGGTLYLTNSSCLIKDTMVPALIDISNSTYSIINSIYNLNSNLIGIHLARIVSSDSCFFRGFDFSTSSLVSLYSIETPGNTNWRDVVNPKQRLKVASNTLSSGGFICDTYSIKVPFTGHYSICLNLSFYSNSIIPREFWVQLVKNEKISLLASASYTTGVNNTPLTLNYIGKFNAGDMIDFRAEQGIIFSNISMLISSWSLSIQYIK